MSEKRATVKDIAREAGVSIATVSYIMNNRTDVKISDQTRKKVLQVANLLNYTPSLAAKSLVTGRTNKIGIAYRMNAGKPTRSLQISNFMYRLLERLERMHYDIQFIPTEVEDTSTFAATHVDGIIAIDLPGELFSTLSNSYLVPIVTVDMIIDDSLFYQVYTDIPAALQTLLKSDPDAVVVMESYDNENYNNFIRSGVPADRFCGISHPDEPTLKNLAGRKVIVIGAYLAMMLRPYVREEDMTVIAASETMSLISEHCRRIENDTDKKANLTINLLLNAIDHNFSVTHRHLLPLNI